MKDQNLMLSGESAVLGSITIITYRSSNFAMLCDLCSANFLVSWPLYDNWDHNKSVTLTKTKQKQSYKQKTIFSSCKQKDKKKL